MGLSNSEERGGDASVLSKILMYDYPQIAYIPPESKILPPCSRFIYQTWSTVRIAVTAKRVFATPVTPNTLQS